MAADGIQNVNQQVSTAVDFSDTEGGETCDLIGNIMSSNSFVAKGLYSLISSVMTDFDSRADATTRSQDQVAFSFDRLTGVFDNLLQDAPSPFIMQHALRISGLRKRVKALNTALKSTQRRIDNMDQMLFAGSVHGLFFFSLPHSSGFSPFHTMFETLRGRMGASTLYYIWPLHFHTILCFTENCTNYSYFFHNLAEIC